MEKRSPNYIEILKKPSDYFEIGEKCTWTKHKYMVEVKAKEDDLCKIRVIKESPTDKCRQSYKIDNTMWVFCKDLKHI